MKLQIDLFVIVAEQQLGVDRRHVEADEPAHQAGGGQLGPRSLVRRNPSHFHQGRKQRRNCKLKLKSQIEIEIE